MEITTIYECPPIGVRFLDWIAFYPEDNHDEEGIAHYGSGATQLDAICDLISNNSDHILCSCCHCEEQVRDDSEYCFFNDNTVAHRDCHRDAN